VIAVERGVFVPQSPDGSITPITRLRLKADMTTDGIL